MQDCWAQPHTTPNPNPNKSTITSITIEQRLLSIDTPQTHHSSTPRLRFLIFLRENQLAATYRYSFTNLPKPTPPSLSVLIKYMPFANACTSIEIIFSEEVNVRIQFPEIL